MQLTGTLHPPAAATALIAALGGTGIENTGWLVSILTKLCTRLKNRFHIQFVPLVAMGTVVLLIVALITNNLADCSQYPVYWWWCCCRKSLPHSKTNTLFYNRTCFWSSLETGMKLSMTFDDEEVGDLESRSNTYSTNRSWPRIGKMARRKSLWFL